jgi:hypothetical protein
MDPAGNWRITMAHGICYFNDTFSAQTDAGQLDDYECKAATSGQISRFKAGFEEYHALLVKDTSRAPELSLAFDNKFPSTLIWRDEDGAIEPGVFLLESVGLNPFE